MSAAALAETLQSEGWEHVPDDGRDTWWSVTEGGEIIRVQWRNPSFVVRLTGQPADAEGHQLRWEATLFHASDQMVVDAARAALSADDDPPLMQRLPETWHICPLRAMDADPLASFSYETTDGQRYLELRVVHDDREQVRPTLYAVCEDTGARIYTEPSCPSGVVAAVALG